jgi:serine/threonine protein kinase
MTLNEGQLLQDRYRIEHLVARGGYGAVYKAFDITLNRICAVKENLAPGLHAVRQFEQEAQLLARLHHPNLPRVIDHFLLPDHHQYLVMDFVEGRNLHEILRSRLRPLSEDEALAIIYQVCSALTYLHNQTPPIVHRDVKPQNIIVTPEGPVMLVDFGVSKVATAGTETLAGARGLSPGYAAPEQYGMAPTDARTDVYGVGATLYSLLTGHPPVDALERLTQHVVLPPIRQYNGSVNPAVEQAVYKAMALAGPQRQNSVELFSQDLHSAQRTGKRAGGTPFATPWRWALAVGAAALLVLLIAGILRTVDGRTQWPPGDSNALALLPPTATGTAPPTATTAATAAMATAPPTVTMAATAAMTASVSHGVVSSTPVLATAVPASPVSASLPAGDTAVPATPAPATPTPVQTPTASATARPPTSTPLPPATATPTLFPTATPAAVRTPLGGGGVIVFDRGPEGSRNIYSLLPDGSGETALITDPADDWIGSSMSDSLLLFSSNRSGNWDIYSQDLESGTISNLTSDSADDHDPAWSPANNRVLFHSDRSDKTWQVFSMNSDGSDVRALTDDARGAWAGAWSPDGSKIVFSANYPRPADIYVMNADGSNVVNLTNTPAHESTPHWSPDGQRIAFYSERDGNKEIYLMNADGSNLQRLTNDTASDTTPNWSPDGMHVVFASNRQGTMQLYRIDLATRDITQLTNDSQADGSPAWTLY